MKAKRIFLSALAALSLCFTACSVKVANMTPQTVPTNPSGIYTLSVKADVSDTTIDRRTVAAYVVIDGEKNLMKRSDLGANIFDYDYEFPPGKTSAEYYYIINYRLKSLTGEPGDLKEIVSPTHRIKLVERFSITLDADRAPAGTRLAVLGRGFARGDTVYVGGNEARTEFVSANSLRFVVPNLAPGRYPVEIRNGGQTDSAGMLRVDKGASLRVLPERLDLAVGERQVLAFAMDEPAPDGGLYLDVRTNIPDSIIMPEVVVPGGARTVNVTVEGNEPGQGMLYVSADGAGRLEIPVTVAVTVE